MNSDALEQIESKIAFLERANTELSDVVFRQQQELEALQVRVAALMARLESAQAEQGTAYTPEQERPPHY
jgi:SlyX protein